MFEKIQHIGYLTPDLDRAIAWFEESFNAVKAGGGPLNPGYAMPSGGRNAYVRFGNAEAELLEPVDQTGLSSEILTMHHVGYVVAAPLIPSVIFHRREATNDEHTAEDDEEMGGDGGQVPGA